MKRRSLLGMIGLGALAKTDVAQASAQISLTPIYGHVWIDKFTDTGMVIWYRSFYNSVYPASPRVDSVEEITWATIPVPFGEPVVDIPFGSTAEEISKLAIEAAVGMTLRFLPENGWTGWDESMIRYVFLGFFPKMDGLYWT